MPVQTVNIDPQLGYKNVTADNLYIERKAKYVFIHNYCAGDCGSLAPYMYMNNNVSKAGAVELVQFMQTDALLTTEDWGNPDYSAIQGIYIVCFDLYHFELRAYTDVAKIPVVSESQIEKVMTSEDISDTGMQLLVGEFLTWYLSTDEI